MMEVIFFGEPQAEGRAPVVVPGQLVVETEALRPGPREANREPASKVLNRSRIIGETDTAVIGLGEVEPLHSAGSSKAASSRETFSAVRLRFSSLPVSV